MPRNGSGVYSKPPGTTAVQGTTISSADYNQTIDDFVADANAARPVVAGGTGSSTAAEARAKLGLSIGTQVQGYSATLGLLANLTTSADQILYTTGNGVYAATDLTPFSRGLLAQPDALAARTRLSIPEVIDQDDMSDNSSTRPPSQQSVRAYVRDQAIGVDQTWQNVLSSRAVGISYRNTTGKPIKVSVTVGGGADRVLEFQVSPNASAWMTIGRGENEQQSQTVMIGDIIPNGTYYRVIGNGTPDFWAELR